jgi:hypothetical protein
MIEAATYDFRLLVCAAALPLPFAGGNRISSSPEFSYTSSKVRAGTFFGSGGSGGGGGPCTISKSESDSLFFNDDDWVAFAAARFFAGRGSSSISISISSSDGDILIGAFGRARDEPAAGARGLRGALAAAAAAFLVGMKSSSPPESSPSPPRPRLPPPPRDLRVLSVACFRLTFLPLESTTPFSSHSWHAFCLFCVSSQRNLQHRN